MATKQAAPGAAATSTQPVTNSTTVKSAKTRMQSAASSVPAKPNKKPFRPRILPPAGRTVVTSSDDSDDGSGSGSSTNWSFSCYHCIYEAEESLEHSQNSTDRCWELCLHKECHIVTHRARKNMTYLKTLPQNVSVAQILDLCLCHPVFITTVGAHYWLEWYQPHEDSITIWAQSLTCTVSV